LADARHNRRREIKRRIQNLFRNPFFPSVRQASVYSRLAVANNGNCNADKDFFPLG
jgi:hypothetical protein